jgi:hypothetical protein
MLVTGDGLGTRLRARVLTVAVLGALGVAAGPAMAAGSGAAPAKPKAASLSQHTIVASKRITVTISGKRGDRVRLSALLSEGGHEHALTTSRTVRFARTGSVRTTLALSTAGRRTMSACRTSSARLVIQARAVDSRGKLGRSVSVTGALKRDAARCASAPAPPPAAAPIGPVPVPAPAAPAPPAAVVPPADEPVVPKIDVSNADRCDFTAPVKCLLPFPNDYFTVADSSTPTGRRLNLNAESMPANVHGTHIDPTDYNRADGFSPGSAIVVKVPGMDTPAAIAQTGAVPITDQARYLDADQPVVVINARTGQRQQIWAELDSNASTPEATDLEIHPGKNFTEGDRYIVALRNMRDADGNIIAPSDGFRVYRDDITTKQPEVEARRGHMNGLFDTLAQSGIERDDLYLAWDFTVASQQSLSGRMLSIRDRAFAELGDTDLSDLAVSGHAPTFAATKQDFTQVSNPQIARRVKGTVTVPCFLFPDCGPGGTFHIGSDGNPVQNTDNPYEAKFECNIPWAAVGDPGDDVTPARPTLYGHGLFGDASSVESQTELPSEHNFVNCAADWIGMADEDVPDVGGSVLTDLSNMPEIADRAQQGMLDFLYLGRAMIHPDGFNSDPAFQFDKSGTMESVIDTQRLYYTGGSQGGIMGGSLSAIAPDFTRGYLGVPGMNYSLLLPRSTDFDEFSPVLYGSYPDQGDHPLLFSIMQLLWDRGEADGYAQHMTTSPLPDTPAHKLLLQMAYGDHQVSNVTTEVEIRTIGAQIRTPLLDPGRSPYVTPFYNIPTVQSYPYDGTAVSLWDVGPMRDIGGGTIKGTPSPPIGNLPNTQGVDPHGPDASEQVTGRQQVSDFLDVGGVFNDTCGSAPCYLDGWTGPPQ